MDPLVLPQLLLPGVHGVAVLAGLEEREYMYTIIMVCMGYREILSHIEHEQTAIKTCGQAIMPQMLVLSPIACPIQTILGIYEELTNFRPSWTICMCPLQAPLSENRFSQWSHL